MPLDEAANGQRADTRGAIVDAAIVVFSARGYSASTMEQVAHAAGIAKGSLYHHFPRKEEILVCIHARFMDDLLSRARERESADQDPASALRGHVADLVDDVARRRAAVEVFLRERCNLSGPDWQAERTSRRAYAGVIERALRRGQEVGVVRTDVDPKIIAFGLIGMCSWLYQWYGEADDQGVVARTFDVLALDGLRARA